MGKDGQHAISLSVSGGNAGQDQPKDLLTVIIERLNAKYGTEFSEHEKLSMQQILEFGEARYSFAYAGVE